MPSRIAREDSAAQTAGSAAAPAGRSTARGAFPENFEKKEVGWAGLRLRTGLPLLRVPRINDGGWGTLLYKPRVKTKTT